MFEVRSLIRELVLYEFERSNNTTQVTKKDFGAKGRNVLLHIAENRWLEKIHSSC